MKTIKKSVSILLSVIMVFSLFTIVPFSASAASSGSNGGFNWTLDDEGTLTLTGSGTLNEGNSNFNSNNNIKKVVFTADCGDVSVEKGTFHDCVNLMEVVINSTTKVSVGHNAFFKYGGGAYTITITAPVIELLGEWPFFNYWGAETFTLNGKVFAAPGIMTSARNNVSILINGEAVISQPAGVVFSGSMAELYQDEYDYAASNGASESRLQRIINEAIEDGCTVEDREASETPMTSENASQVFGNAVVTFDTSVASVTSGGTTTKYSELSTALTNWTDGSTLTLLADVSINSAINVTSGTKTLDLNGKTITMTGNDCILYVNGGSLTVNGNGGTLTGGKGGRNHGDSYRRGGAIDLKSGSIILDNCNITNNTASFGGAVFMGGSTTLTIQNGTAFTNNSGGAVFWVQGGTVNMTGGTISNNSTTAVSMQSASWYSDLSRFNMTGGTISNNTGSGVAFSGTPTGICSVSGNAVIKDNTSSNLNLSGGVLLNVNGALGDNASIGITMSNPGVFTNSTDTTLNDPTKFFSDNSSYAVGKNAAGQLILGVPRTITWKDDQGNTIDTTTVVDGETPTHEAPAKNDANGNPYTFGGWKNGTTTYAPDAALPAVTGDTTYTATYKKLIRAHSLTLDGDIGINFFIDPSVAGMNPGDSGTLTVDFEWANDEPLNNDPLVDVVSQSKSVAVNSSNYSQVGDLVKVTCNVCAAEMTCDVKATASLNGKTEAENYSVRKYCDTILDDTSDEGSRIKASYDEAKYSQLIDLVVKMLDYGAKAQTTFGINRDYLANEGLDYTMQTVTDDMFTDAIQPAEGTDISANNIAADTPAGAAFKAPSLVFLTKNTLRLYFEKTGDSFNTSGLTKWNNYYYAQVTNIAAAELDTLQVFNVSGKTLYYSAFDYAKLLLNTSNADIAKALYWYNQAANVFFDDEPEEVAVHTITIGEESQTVFVEDSGFQRIDTRVTFEYRDNDTWADMLQKYDCITTEDWDLAPGGKIIHLKLDGVSEWDYPELKSDQSTHSYELVSINDKVSDYTSYYWQS